MAKTVLQQWVSRFESAMARLGHGFVQQWGRLERAYRRPGARLALRMGHEFYPLLAVIALAWLGWDWQHARSLDAAEDALFDKVIKMRPWERAPSGKVAIVEIDDCSLAHLRAQGMGSWPWSRQLHADLLDRLDRAGARAVGVDVLLVERSASDPDGDATLEAMAQGGAGRFVFAASRMAQDYDDNATLPVSKAPAAFPVGAMPRHDPPVALMLPFGAAMARHAALVDVTRAQDGVLRDVPLRIVIGDWAIPALPLRLAVGTDRAKLAAAGPSVRVDWRTRTRLPRVSAADVFADGQAICRDAGTPMPDLKGRTVLVGYTAAGLNDAKPTPVDPRMPGVEVWAEATEALLTGSAIWMPAAWFKYLLAALLTLLTTFVFYRGEPTSEIDQIFVATNLLLLSVAFIGLTAFGVFFDIFAAVGFVSLCFGLCRTYAGVQRGYASGNDDFRVEFDPRRHRVLALARLRFAPDAGMDAQASERSLREYRRRMRRFLQANSSAVSVEHVVERKSWLWESMNDLTVLIWPAEDAESAEAAAMRELDELHRHLSELDAVLADDGCVRLACASTTLIEAETSAQTRARIRGVLGDLLQTHSERPLSAQNAFVIEAT